MGTRQLLRHDYLGGSRQLQRRQELFDQTHLYGPARRPKSGRLLLLSCGGLFDNRTGHYESNIFVYAFPV